MLKKIILFFCGEFQNWRMSETLYLLACTSAICGISLYLGDTALGIASAVTGTLYTLLAGKGKISCYFFGIFNSASYGYIAFEQKLYGDTLLNWCWYLPMMFVGIFFWRKRMNDDQCVIKNKLDLRSRVIWAAACAAAILIFAAALHFSGGSQPLIDASTTVLSVAAMILTVKRCMEQWLLWILVNGISVGMWLKVYLTGGNSIATLLWWLIMLITGVIFYIKWYQDVNKVEHSA
jgi:nicotinamide mononucleotide transporter